jgi:hypothetical protein
MGPRWKVNPILVTSLHYKPTIVPPRPELYSAFELYSTL